MVYEWSDEELVAMEEELRTTAGKSLALEPFWAGAMAACAFARVEHSRTLREAVLALKRVECHDGSNPDSLYNYGFCARLANILGSPF